MAAAQITFVPPRQRPASPRSGGIVGCNLDKNGDVIYRKEGVTRYYLLPSAYCLLPTVLYELLRLVEPTLISAIFVGRRGLDRFDAGLHRTGRLATMSESGMRPTHQI